MLLCQINIESILVCIKERALMKEPFKSKILLISVYTENKDKANYFLLALKIKPYVFPIYYDIQQCIRGYFDVVFG